MNEGYSPEAIQELKDECKRLGQSFVYNEEMESEADDDAAYFYFVGEYDGKPVIYDAFMYTLRMEYEMAIYEMAEGKVTEKFPNFKKRSIDEASDDELDYLEVVLDDLEQAEAVKVQEYVEVNDTVDYGVSIDICLNLDTITKEEIENFIRDFNSGKLELDDTEYSFSYGEEDDE